MTYREAAQRALEDGRPDVALVWATLGAGEMVKDMGENPSALSPDEYRTAISTRIAGQMEPRS